MGSSRRRAVGRLAAGVVAAVGALLGVLAWAGVLDAPAALRSGFALAGAVLALAGFWLTRGERALAGAPLVRPRAAAKVGVGAGALALFATVRTGSRVAPLLVFLPLGYLLVADQLAHDGPPTPALVQLCTLFAVPSLAKYLTTGFYFGGTDTFAHVDAVNRLLGAHSTAAIPYGYDFFPVFHLLVAAAKSLAGVGTYDAVVLTGVAFYTALVPVAYLVAARLLGDRRTALAVATAFTILEFVGHYAVYFFPQSLALGLVFVGVHATASMRAAESATRLRRYTLYVVALVGTLALTHHLTYLLFLPVLGLLAGAALVRSSLARWLGVDALRGSPEWGRYRWAFPVVFGVAAVLAYLVFSPSLILVAIISLTYRTATDVVAAAGPPAYVYGAVLPADSVARAVQWYATPTGVYYVSLAGVLLVGGYEFLERVEAYGRSVTLLATSFVFAGLLLPMPVELPQIERFQLVLSLFAVFPVGVALARLLAAPRARNVLLGVAVLTAFGTAGALTHATADDVAAVHLDERNAQVALSDGEYDAVRASAGFLAARRGAVATDIVTRRALRSVGYDPDRLAGVRATPAGLEAPPGYLVVRDAWSEHVVAVGPDEEAIASDFQWFTVSAARQRDAVGRRDKVFAAGPVAVLSSEAPYDGVFGNATGTLA